ncbi:HIT family protein [Aquirhabdus parva]|uniref:HIT family protein n=1 Tax=Aquirhabdus parva TaxID=2283318 RepID=A0A345P2P6_9GAMM|nr:HIT family protein [Aquirhabdus parva]AXI01555.1 HIT family protein [Aquirhabdus parva]
MAYDTNNIFAKILRGEIPCTKVYEDEHTLAFMDIMPQADGHTLVITKEPAETLLDLSPEAAAAWIKTVQKVSKAVKTAMGVEGFVLMQLNGAAAGQTVPHVHFHILPSSLGALMTRAHGAKMGDMAQIQGFAEKIRAALEA